ncbi:MAG: hypothetical protein AUH92_02475 [Acidobacteria bacterium 13_1_40CM_4_69_4]|nr:MAG: hypothetical protein AUH92_02475 [Acidobacteria bacterium 13_1_40CM_4_69_4]
MDAAGADERWADEALGPLRRQTVDCDVAPAVMARILAERDAILPDPVSPRAYGIAWASSVALGVASFTFFVSTLLVLVIGGDEGVREIVRLGTSTWHVLVVFGRLFAEAGGRVLSDALPVLRKVWALLAIAAPIARGAGMLAAAGGVLSILFSSYVFAAARKTAPRVGA